MKVYSIDEYAMHLKNNHVKTRQMCAYFFLGREFSTSSFSFAELTIIGLLKIDFAKVNYEKLIWHIGTLLRTDQNIQLSSKVLV